MLFTFTREACHAHRCKIDEFGKPAWIVLMILGFLAWWPLGLVILAFIIGSGRMGCWVITATAAAGSTNEPLAAKMERMQDEDGPDARAWTARPWSIGAATRSSGNRAFDDYRTETLRRLEEEQREFKEFLERLRFAKDRAEFDQFMAERRNRPHDEAPRRSRRAD